jgi:hypothetical protein
MSDEKVIDKNFLDEVESFNKTLLKKIESKEYHLYNKLKHDQLNLNEKVIIGEEVTMHYNEIQGAKIGVSAHHNKTIDFSRLQYLCSGTKDSSYIVMGTVQRELNCTLT